MSLEHFFGAQSSYHVFWATNEELKKKKKKLPPIRTLARSILVEFRRFSDFSTLMHHCAFIFEDRKILNTAI